MTRILAIVLTAVSLTTIGASAASAAPDPVGTAQDVIDFIASCQPAPDGTFHCH